MIKISTNPIEKTLFFFINIIFIAFLKDERTFLIFFIWLLLLFFLQEGEFKRKILMYASALLFLIPPLFIQGLKYENNNFYLNIDKSILMRVLLTVTTSGIYITSMQFKDFCSVMIFLKVPKYIVEIIIYMYKFITLMHKNYVDYTLSIKSRNGILKVKEIALITTKIFTRLYINLENMEIASYSRGYNDEFHYIKKKQTIRKKVILMYVAYIFIAVFILKNLRVS